MKKIISCGGISVSSDRYLTSKENPTVRLYQKLASQKKERQRYGLFVLEGVRITEDALLCGNVKKLLITEKCAETSGLDFSALRADVYVISEEIASRISQTESPQGVFAVCEIPRIKPVFTDNSRYVVLFGLQDPGNAGTIIRTADALGIDGIFLCGTCDIYSPKALRSTMGAVFRSRICVMNSEEELFSLLKENGVQTVASVVDSRAVPLTELPACGRQAVLIGNEGSGLPENTANRCDVRMTIPMQGNANSLNAAMAAGIIMWEMVKRR